MSTPRTTYQLIEDGRIAERARDHQRSLDRAYTKALNERLASNVDGTPGPAPKKECYPTIPSTPAKVQAQATGGDTQPARDKPRIGEPITPGPDFGGKTYLQFVLFGATVAGLAGSAYAATILQPLNWTHVAEIVAAFVAAAGAMFAVLCNPLVMASIAATVQYPKTMAVVWSGVLYGAFYLFKVI